VTIEESWFDFRYRSEIYLFPRIFLTALELFQPPVQWIPASLSVEVRRLGLEAVNLAPSNTKVNL
jgi:hypothetical protein